MASNGAPLRYPINVMSDTPGAPPPARVSAAGSTRGRKSPPISDEASARSNAGNGKKVFPSTALSTRTAEASSPIRQS